MNASADVVVVGAGVIGCAIAYELSTRGIKVMLLEREAIGSGGSAHATGSLSLLGAEFSPGPSFSQAIQSYRLFPDLVAALEQETGMDLLYQRRPQLRLSLEEQEESLIRDGMLWQGEHLQLAWIDGEEVRRIEPRLSPNVRGAVYDPESAQLDSYRFTLAMAQAAELRGTEILLREVTGLVQSKGRVTHVRHTGGVVACEAVVLSLGPWSGVCTDWIGTPVPVAPMKGERLLLRYDAAPLPVLITSPKRGHMISRLDGLLSVGSTGGRDYDQRELFLGIDFDKQPTEAAKVELLQRAVDVLPDLENAEVVQHLAGSRPLSSDRHPLIGPVPGTEGLFLATGHGTKGIHMAPITARIIAEYILQNSTESLLERGVIQTDIFLPRRFVTHTAQGEESFNAAACDVEE